MAERSHDLCDDRAVARRRPRAGLEPAARLVNCGVRHGGMTLACIAEAASSGKERQAPASATHSAPQAHPHLANAGTRPQARFANSRPAASPASHASPLPRPTRAPISGSQIDCEISVFSPRGKARPLKQGKTFSHLKGALWKFGSGSSRIGVMSSREEGTMSAFADTEAGVTRPHSRTVTSVLVGRGWTASRPKSSLGVAKSGP